MITCNRFFLELRCAERGVSLADAMPCVVKQDGSIWTIDTSHSAYPRARRCNACLAGTALGKILYWLGIAYTPDCPCRSRAALMDAWGCDECEQRIDEIVGWLREEAGKRGLPFLDIAGRMLVKRAIRNARRAAAAKS